MTPNQKNFIEKLDKLARPLYDLAMAYESLSIDENGDTTENYPFSLSYDEWLHEFYKWREHIKYVWSTFEHSPTLTVGELKNIIADLDENVQVVVEDKKNSWWLNINKTQKPDNDGMFTLTFSTTDSFDTTQL